MVTDSGQIVVREQWNHPYKEGSSLFRFQVSVANIVQSSVTWALSLSKPKFTYHWKALYMLLLISILVPGIPGHDA